MLLQNSIYRTDERDYNNCTPLHIAAHEGSEESVIVLLCYGADPTATDDKGRTPLDVAVANRHSNITHLLMRASRSVEDSPALGSKRTHNRTFSNVSDSQEPGSTLGIDPHLGASVSSFPSKQVISSRYTTLTDSRSVVFFMVGLPGRGKSFIAKHIRRYLQWKGVACGVFNAGDYRRDILGAEATASAAFYDPSNKEAVELREKMAELACDDAANFLNTHSPGVAVLDATNTTVDRRDRMSDYFRQCAPNARQLFIESVCEDQRIVRENILRAKFGNADFEHVENPQQVVDQFYRRIREYEKVYETLTVEKERTRSFIRILNVKQRVVLHNVEGMIPTRVGFFLLNLHPVTSPVYIALPGQTVSDRYSVFGGDEVELSDSGRRYREALATFVAERAATGPMKVMYPGAHRTCCDTVALLQGMENVTLLEDDGLADMSYGSFAGLHPSTAETQHPKMFSRLFDTSMRWPRHAMALRNHRAAKLLRIHEPRDEIAPGRFRRERPEYNVAFPKGESSRQMTVRMESVLMTIARAECPLLIVCPEAPASVTTAFVSDLLPEQSPLVDLPPHKVVELGIKGEVTLHDLGVSCTSPTSTLLQGVPPIGTSPLSWAHRLADPASLVLPKANTEAPELDT